MSKAVAAVGGLIAFLGPILSIYIPFLGMWYYTLDSPHALQWIDVLGTYNWEIGSLSGTSDNPIQIVQILGILILVGAVLCIIGGLANTKIIALLGSILIFAGIAIFALTLQTTLDDNDIIYSSDYSIFLTYNQDVYTIMLTQMLGGGFWTATIGGVLALAGAAGMKK